MDAYDVAVIGLGAMGAATTYELARAGKRVIAFEQFALGHQNGSSHGESRAIRLTYFEGAAYVPLLRRAYRKWRDLEDRSKRSLLTLTGMLNAGPPGSAMVANALKTAAEQSLPHEALSPEEAMRRFPAFRIPADWTAMLDPNGGFLRPERAISSFVEGALQQGAETRLHAKVDAVMSRPDGARVVVGGESIDVGAVVVTAGPWIQELVGDIPEVARLRFSPQVTAWLQPERPELFAENLFPVFGFDTPHDGMIYGFPNFAGTGVKVAFHDESHSLTSLAERPAAADEAALDRLIDAAGRYIPGATGSLRPEARTCIYTNTPDERFLIDRAPGRPHVLFASACSGHGFKFASAIGEGLAQMAITGATPPLLAPFGLAAAGGPLA